VWLTIDDGPSADTAAILDLLDAHAARRRSSSSANERASGPTSCARSSGAATRSATTASTHPQAWFWALGPARMRAQDRRQPGRARGAYRHPAALVPRGGRHGQSVRVRALREHGLARVAWSARGFDALAADPQRWWRASSATSPRRDRVAA
jgi:peptidoglycan/xylan/chitin deacetylase (PgdA/CDA1 family)